MTEKLYKAKVSYYETDCMNIVHHSNFIRYFEDARIQYMHDIGCDVPKCSQKDCIFQMLTHMPVTKSRLNSAMSIPLK